MAKKRKILVLSLICLFFLGCSITRGPISKRIYYSPDDPRYKRELLEFNRKDFVLEHAQLPEAVKQCILKGNFKIGMTTEQVRVSLGEPTHIYRSTSGRIINEQWVYELEEIEDASGFLRNKILYFDNGILKSWQE